MGRYFTIEETGYRLDMSGGSADIVRIFKYVDGFGYQFAGVMSMGRYFTIQGTEYRFDMSGGPADIVRIFKYVDGFGYQFAHEALDLESAINYCETNEAAICHSRSGKDRGALSRQAAGGGGRKEI